MRREAPLPQGAKDGHRAALLAEITEAADEVPLAKLRIHTAVDDPRNLKLATWGEIGAAIGIDGQAAYPRYGKRALCQLT